MSQEPPTQPVDPWADATETEQFTQPAPWQPGQPGTPVPPPAPDVIEHGRLGGGNRGPLVALAALLVVVLVVGGIGLNRVLSRGHGGDAGTGTIGTTGSSAAGRPAGASTGGSAPSPTAPATTDTPGTPSDSPTPAPSTTSGRPQSPEDAQVLTDAQAATELGTEADEDGPAVANLAGSWVPQVDGKCVGVSVDIQPNYIPDGTPDTPHVTIQQILAFHLSLHKRFNALTVRQSQLGIGSDTATSGPCAGQVIWNSVVPRTFGSAQEANAWCDVNVPPVHECLARYVARPGEVSRAVERG